MNSKSLVTQNIIYHANQALMHPNSTVNLLSLFSLIEVSILYDEVHYIAASTFPVASNQSDDEHSLFSLLQQESVLQSESFEHLPENLEYYLDLAYDDVSFSIFNKLKKSILKPSNLEREGFVEDSILKDDFWEEAKYCWGYQDIYTRFTEEFISARKFNIYEFLRVIDSAEITRSKYEFYIYFLRTYLYWAYAAENQMSLRVDIGRQKFLGQFILKQHLSLPEEAYRIIENSINGTVEESQKHGNKKIFSIPPLVAMVLYKCKGDCQRIPESILDVRSQFGSSRKQLNEIEWEIQNARSIHDAQTFIKKEKQIFNQIKSPLGEDEIVLEEGMQYMADLSSSLRSPTPLAEFSTKLVTLPANLIYKWWIRRPVAELLSMRRKVERMKDLLPLLDNTFNKAICPDVIESIFKPSI